MIRKKNISKRLKKQLHNYLLNCKQRKEIVKKLIKIKTSINHRIYNYLQLKLHYKNNFLILKKKFSKKI